MRPTNVIAALLVCALIGHSTAASEAQSSEGQTYREWIYHSVAAGINHSVEVMPHKLLDLSLEGAALWLDPVEQVWMVSFLATCSPEGTSGEDDLADIEDCVDELLLSVPGGDDSDIETGHITVVIFRGSFVDAIDGPAGGNREGEPYYEARYTKNSARSVTGLDCRDMPSTSRFWECTADDPWRGTASNVPLPADYRFNLVLKDSDPGTDDTADISPVVGEAKPVVRFDPAEATWGIVGHPDVDCQVASLHDVCRADGSTDGGGGSKDGWTDFTIGGIHDSPAT